MKQKTLKPFNVMVFFILCYRVEVAEVMAGISRADFSRFVKFPDMVRARASGAGL